MNIKPKELIVNLPIVLMFDNSDDISVMVQNINKIIHGKLRLKYDELGLLGAQYVGLFYLYRDQEYHSLRNEFKEMIDKEELEIYNNG